MTGDSLQVALLCAVTCATSAHAQDTPDVETNPWLIGGSVGMPSVGGEFEPSFFTLAVHGTHGRRGGIGPDLFLGTMPRALFEGIMAVGARAGLAWAAPLSEDMLLLPSGGVSFIGGFGQGGGGAEFGGNVGLSVIAHRDSSGGFRLGMTWHRFADLDGSLWLLEFGFVRGRAGR